MECFSFLDTYVTYPFQRPIARPMRKRTTERVSWIAPNFIVETYVRKNEDHL
jgi:hypothetical protein